MGGMGGDKGKRRGEVGKKGVKVVDLIQAHVFGILDIHKRGNGNG